MNLDLFYIDNARVIEKYGNSICKHVSFNTSPLCRTCPMIYLHFLYVSIWGLALSPSTSDCEIFNSHGSKY